eukprot:1499162-Prymnesium_polylepis.2
MIATLLSGPDGPRERHLPLWSVSSEVATMRGLAVVGRGCRVEQPRGLAVTADTDVLADSL